MAQADKSQKTISTAVIRRLPRYYRYLGDLLSEGVERISSQELSRRMHVTASQIRQDLNNFGGFGQQGYGYNVSYLHNEISKILGLDETHNIIVIGSGNLGQALAKYGNFERRGFRVIGLFDRDPALIGRLVNNLVIQNTDSLEDFLRAHDVDIVALTLPKDGAIEMAKKVRSLGIRAIWNFAHVDLDDMDGLQDMIVENVHLSDSLMALSYAMKEGRPL